MGDKGVSVPYGKFSLKVVTILAALVFLCLKLNPLKEIKVVSPCTEYIL